MLEKKLKKPSRYKENDIFRYDGNKLHKINDLLSIEYKNKTFRKYLNDYDKLEREHINLKDELHTYKECLMKFYNDVLDKDYDYNMKTLIRLLYNELIINENKDYDLVELDIDGYIQSIKNINGIIIENELYPNDILNGYYKIEDNKPVLDEDRMTALYNQL